MVKHRWRDMALCGGLLLVGSVLLGVLWMTSRGGAAVEVRVDGKLSAEYSLNQNMDIVIHGTDGGTNRLRIEGGEAWLEEASCPDGLCVHMGRISKVGQSVICLPNRVVIRVTGNDAEDDIDATVGR